MVFISELPELQLWFQVVLLKKVELSKFKPESPSKPQPLFSCFGGFPIVIPLLHHYTQISIQYSPIYLIMFLGSFQQ